MKRNITKVIFSLIVTGGICFSGCTKTSGCEFVDGDRYLTGTFHYFDDPVQIPQWPYPANAIILDVNSYLVRDNSTGDFLDTIVITKSSVPKNYRKEGEKHVAVSIESTFHGTATITEARHEFYKLLCIEEIRSRLNMKKLTNKRFDL